MSSSLEPLESDLQTKGLTIRIERFGNPEFDIETVSLDEATFRHSGWAARRSLVFDALKRCGTSYRNIDAFCNCGSALYAMESEKHDDTKLTCNHCRSRWCIPCATARAATLSGNLRQILDTRQARFLTLTLRHSHTPLADQLSRLFTCFTMLRRRNSWKTHVRGGAAFIELTLSQKTGLWHVHLHILAQGTFYDQKELSLEWHAVTGDSSIVDIRDVPNIEHVARYVTKYVTKPADASVFAQPAKLDEMIVSLRGRHLCFTFGTWRKLKLTAIPDDGIKWNPIGRVDQIFRHAQEGAPKAIRWAEALLRKWPELQIFTIRPPPETPPYLV